MHFAVIAPAAQDGIEMFTLPLAGGAVVQPALGPLGNGVVAVPLLAIEPLAPPEALPLPEPPLVPPLVEAPPEAPLEEVPEAAPEVEAPELPTPLVAPDDSVPLVPAAAAPLVDPEAVWPPALEPALEVPEPDTFMFDPPFEVPQATSPMATRARYPNQRIFAEPSLLFFARRYRQRGIAPAGTSAVKARHARPWRCPARLDSSTEDGKRLWRGRTRVASVRVRGPCPFEAKRFAAAHFNRPLIECQLREPFAPTRERCRNVGVVVPEPYGA